MCARIRAHSVRMMSLADIVRRLQDAPHGALRQLERDTGVPYGTLRKIKDGQTTNPGLATIEPIVAWLLGHPNDGVVRHDSES